eukprot:TRINITY_DN11488_c0_g1_i2.p1 TRINITY_DN11488_c0_g1~~TRINITY_DN11488_c0_g1_i2.p1  ORF type:complete len:441 (+),score=142.89 TRINITY_DN11488_c0_g1_i2:574-1896(+)
MKLLFALLASIQLVACHNLLVELRARRVYSTLVSLIELADLEDAVSAATGSTLFAPNNNAFSRLDATVVAKLQCPANKQALRNILLNHLTGSVVRSSDFRSGNAVTSLFNQQLDLDHRSGRDIVDGVRVTSSARSAGTNVYYKIREVLIPDGFRAPAECGGDTILDELRSRRIYSTLVTALELTNLSSVLDTTADLTIFAPNDNAFDALPDGVLELLTCPRNLHVLADVLRNHVLGRSRTASQLIEDGSATTLFGTALPITQSNGEVFVHNARVLRADLTASNGIIHKINSVLVPDIALPTTCDDSLLATVLADPDLSTLVEVVGVADLVDTLRDADNVTVFAPTNQAWEELCEQTDRDQAAAIIVNHIVAGTFPSTQLTPGGLVQTLAEENLRVRNRDGDLFVGQAGVTTADIAASNGIVHKIDAILVPCSLDLAEICE